MSLGAAALDEPRFTDRQCDDLFAAVLIDDEVDAQTELPATIRLDFGERQLTDCFRICRQLWTTGVDRQELLTLAQRLWRDRDLSPDDRLRFKYARAKFKHLRFAYALYGSSHGYPVVLDWMTTAMGHLQDAFKNGRKRAVGGETALFRLFLAAGPRHLLEREVNSFTPSSSAGFRSYVLGQMAAIKGILSREALTGAKFHATRKIISRQVSFYDSLRTIEPGREAYLMSRSLSAINGLMGRMHDDLVEQRLAGSFDYHREPLTLPAAIRSRLESLVTLYPV